MIRVFRLPPHWLVLISLLVGLASGVSCKPSSVSDESDASSPTSTLIDETRVASREPSDEKAIEVSPIEIPAGTPEQMFDFIDGLDQELDLSESASDDGQTTELSADARQAIALRRVMEARFAACKKILARQVPEETRFRAIMIQLDALRTLVALDPETMTPRFDEYTKRIAASGDPLLARTAKATRFQQQVNQTLSGDGPADADLLAQLQSLLDDPDAGPEVLNATGEAATWLLQHGDVTTATQAFRQIGQRFESHPDENIAAEGKSLASQAIRLDLTQLAERVLQEQPQALSDLMAKVESLLATTSPDANTLAYTMQTAQLLEFSGHVPEARKAYQLINDRYQDGDDKSLSADVQRSVELAERRLTLIGQPLDVEGVLLDGEVFDWAKYRGQWVVLCFWTTWHQGWLDEVKNIRQAIAAYQEPAVEVVAISLDDDRNTLERFLQEHPTSWPVLVDADREAAGFENPNARRCGVEAVPFVLLIDPQGQVVDIHLLGKRLAASLAEHVVE